MIQSSPSGDKRVVVTGAAGFIGRHVLCPLVRRGFDVHAVDISRDPEQTEAVTWHCVDLFQSAELECLLQDIRPTHLLHFSWFVKHGDFWTSEENLRWVRASLDLYQAFHQAGGRRIVTSGTCAEYDWREDFLSEIGTRLRPATLYGACKHALQIMLSSYADQTGISSAWGRIFFLYGPYESPSRLVAGVIQKLLRGEPAYCSHGKQIRDFLHVQDVADAFVALLDCGVRGPVNIASGEPVAIKEVLLEIGRLLESESLIRLGARPVAASDPPVLRADATRLRNEVGWVPKRSLPEGLTQTISWWKDHLCSQHDGGEVKR